MSPRMFVRFQRQGARLHVRLLQTRRTSGKIRSEYIGALGSVDTVASVRERLAFWAKLPERLLRLGNRVNEDQHAAIYAALHARIPMVTPDEQREIQVENAKDNERFWDIIQEMNASSAEGHKLLIASAEAKRQEHERLAAAAAEKREVARAAGGARAGRKRCGRARQEAPHGRRGEESGFDPEGDQNGGTYGGGVRDLPRATLESWAKGQRQNL